MRLFFYEYVQVAIDAVVRSGIAFAAHGQLHVLTHAGRDVNLDDFIAFHDAFATAVGAFLLDDFACTIAGGTHRLGLHLSEEAVDGLHHLSAAVAGGTGLGGAVLRSAAMAMGACHIFGDLDFLLYAMGDLLQVEFHLHADVGAALFDAAASAAASAKTETATEAAEVEAAAEHAVEDVVQVEVAEAAKAACARRSAVHAGEAVTVVTRLLVLVAQDGIGFRGFLEFLLGGLLLFVGAVHPLVGVPLEGGLTVGALYLVRCGTLVDAQHLVVISFFCHS